MARFDGQVAIVSGGANGQGAAEARALVAEGAGVVIGDVDCERGTALADALGLMARFCRLDVASEADWQAAVSDAEAMGPVTALINNAGIFRPDPIMDTSRDAFDAHYRINQLGPFLGIKTVIPAMQRAGRGAIVNVSSVAGLVGAANTIAYGATKWALRGMTRIAAAELGSLNIRVNSIHPGLIETAMTEFLPEETRRKRATEMPLGRLATVEEVTAAVLFLLSDAASAMTGAELKIDCGAVL